MIPKTVLVLAGPFGEQLNAELVAAAIGHGLAGEGRFEYDLCPLEEDLGQRTAEASKLLDGSGLDRRMRGARALVIACAHLNDRTLAGSIAFEAATRARQSGVPAYAITGRDELDSFEARIVDLQVILQADSSRALTSAGRKLAVLM